jgi:pyruvate/2-oxoglutarate dehydrogenase complex dihydrolipoamide dehydrogenase (E3) component
MTNYDAVVIGAGQAGAPLAMRLAATGLKVAIIERASVGGTCVNTGCTPTKALVASAYTAQQMRRAAEYGIVPQTPVRVDMRQVKARKDKIVADRREGLRASLESADNCTLIHGHGRLLSPHEVDVGGIILRTGRVFIDVGSRGVVPPTPGLQTVDYLDNESILQLDILPRHLIILGGSYIALEFAQMYRRFGSEVTIVEKASGLISREDEDVSLAVQGILEAEGITVHLGATATRVAQQDGIVTLSIEREPDITGSHLLLAVGRRPNTDNLGLAAAGIEQDEHGFIKVDDMLRTNVPGIWAMGDCNGRGAFTHTAYNDYEIIAANLLDDDARRVSERISAYAIYIDPPLGRVGMTEAQARLSGRKVLIARRPMTQVARAIEKGETQGFIKVLVDAATQRFLGAAILGSGGDEVVHSVLDLMAADAPYTVMQRAVHIHPTVSELLPTVLSALRPLAIECADGER